MTSGVDNNWRSLILHGVNPTGKEIGRGAYGRVFEVNYEGTLCAAKEVHALLLQYAEGDNLQKIKDDFLNECQIWSTLRHPYIVQFLGMKLSPLALGRIPRTIKLYTVDSLILINNCDIIRSVLSRNGPVQITCYGNGEDAA